MAVRSIVFVEEIDNEPTAGKDYEGAYEQGSTYTNQRIYRLTNDDGKVQYLQIGLVHDSYGREEGIEEPKLVIPKEKTVTYYD